MDGTYSISYGVDGIFKLFKNDYFNFKLAQVMDRIPLIIRLHSIPPGYSSTGKDTTIKASGYDFTYTRSGKDFKPEMGFQQRKDYSFYAGSFNTDGSQEKLHR